MFAVLAGIFDFIVGLFTSGGFFVGLSVFLTGAFNTIVNLLTGGFKRIVEVWAYIMAWHTVEIIRRFILIALIGLILGFVINYAMTNLLVFEGNSLSALLNSYLTAISSFGPVGQDFLALASKLGLFDAITIVINIMLFTLVARIALSILLK